MFNGEFWVYEIDISKYKLDYPSDDSRGFNQATKSQNSITHLSKSINLKFPKEPRKPKQNIPQKPPTPNAPKVAKKVRKPKNRL